MRQIFAVLKAVSALLARQTSAFVTAVAVFAFFVPGTFNWVAGNAQSAVLGVIMLAMGMTLTKADFVALAKTPVAIFIGAVAQYTIMPLVAFAVGRALNLPSEFAVGLVLVGCCPGGVSSNIMSFLCKGDVAYSVGMTTVSTLLAPIATPALTALLANRDVPVDAVGMFGTIIWVTLLPVAVGSLANAAFGGKRAYRHILDLMPGVAVVGLACIVGGVVSHNGHLFLSAGAIIFLAIFLHNTLGYVLGWVVARLFGMNRARRRTLSIEVGMQNAGMATVLARRHFAALPGAEVISAASCVYHSITGALLAGFFLAVDRIRADKSIKN